MKVELFMAKRLRLAPGDGGRRSPAVAIAIGGVALAVAVMLITLAVVVGFQNAIKAKVMGFEAPIKLHPLGKVYEDEAGEIELSGELQQVVGSAIPQAQTAAILTQPAVLKTPDNFAGVNINAFSAGHDFSFERGNMIEGAYPEQDNELALSELTADKLGLKVGDKLDGAFMVDNSIRLRRFVVSGIFSSNFVDYDKLTAYATFPTLQKIRKLPDGFGDAVEITGISLDEVPEASTMLHLELQGAFNRGELTEGMYVTNVTETGAAYLSWLELLDSNVVVILVIMTLVSGFTLISCMFILILQRVGMIGILKSLGATNATIRRIFLLLGGRIILYGLVIGNLTGLGLLMLQKITHLIKLDPSAYYLDEMPVEIDLTNVLTVNVAAVAMAAILMLIPASVIARISPSKTMHYE